MARNNSSIVGPIIVLLLLGFFLLLAVDIVPGVEGGAKRTLESYECNPDTWGEGGNDPYGENVANTIDKLIANTPQDPHYTQEVIETNQGTTVYGYASCDLYISSGDCSECLEEAFVHLADLCPGAVGAQILMVDYCLMRYENYPFFNY